MNEQRRKILSELFVKIEEIKGKVEDWRDEEQAAFDAMPSSFQQSDCGKKSEVSISCIEGCIDGLEKALNSCAQYCYTCHLMACNSRVRAAHDMPDVAPYCGENAQCLVLQGLAKSVALFGVVI